MHTESHAQNRATARMSEREHAEHLRNLDPNATARVSAERINDLIARSEHEPDVSGAQDAATAVMPADHVARTVSMRPIFAPPAQQRGESASTMRPDFLFRPDAEHDAATTVMHLDQFNPTVEHPRPDMGLSFDDILSADSEQEWLNTLDTIHTPADEDTSRTVEVLQQELRGATTPAGPATEAPEAPMPESAPESTKIFRPSASFTTKRKPAPHRPAPHQPAPAHAVADTIRDQAPLTMHAPPGPPPAQLAPQPAPARTTPETKPSGGAPRALVLVAMLVVLLGAALWFARGALFAA